MNNKKSLPIMFWLLGLVLTFNGLIILLIWMRETVVEWGNFILWVAIANIVVGIVSFFTAHKLTKIHEKASKP